jgi:proliferating cell nuclear antigen PCNA
MSDNNYILEIKTIQASTIKSVIDAMKEILMDVNLEFDENGMKIVALDNTHIVLIHLKLQADKFESYYCMKKLYVGINMLKFHMLIKTIQNGDILSLFIHKDDPNILGITIENNEKNVKTTYKLSMLDIDVVNVDIPPADFNTIITNDTMVSTDRANIIDKYNHFYNFNKVFIVIITIFNYNRFHPTLIRLIKKKTNTGSHYK